MARPRALVKAEAPSEWALRDLPARVATFLYVLGNAPEICARMRGGGYSQRDHAEGTALLAAACAYRAGNFDASADDAARASAAELTAWARAHLARLRAALLRLHPEHAALFAGLDTSDEAHAVLSVATCLERVGALERALGSEGTAGVDDTASAGRTVSAGRKPGNAERESGAVVLVTLEQRKFGAAERARLRALVERAQRAELALDEHAPSSDGAQDELRRLLRWYEDWALTARAVMGRRDWLVRLGLVRKG